MQAGIKLLPEDIFAEYKIKNEPRLLAILNEWIAELNLDGSLAAISFPAMLTNMQRLKLAPRIREAAIEAEVYAKVQEDFPDMTETLCIDWAELERTQDYTDIVFVAAREAYVSQIVSCVNAAGLNTKIVDVDIYALKRAIVVLLNKQGEAIWAALYTQAGVATLIVFNHRHIVFYHHWDIDVNEILALQLKNHLQRFLTSKEIIEKLILCIEKKYEGHDFYTALKHLQPTEIYIEYPLFSNKLLFATHIDSAWFMHHLEDFLIACGLAMRERLAW